MTLYEKIYSVKPEDQNEFTVIDSVWDLESYFYNDEEDNDWQKAMNILAKKLQVVDENYWGIKVNLYGLIDKNIETLNLSGLFRGNVHTDDIMEDMEDILSGGVTEEWMLEFVECLEV